MMKLRKMTGLVPGRIITGIHLIIFILMKLKLVWYQMQNSGNGLHIDLI